MFICNYCRDHCLEEKGIGIIKSKGGCEVCEYYDVCTDIHGYTFKSKWKELKYNEKGEKLVLTTLF